MSRRSRARELALQMLYQKDLNPEVAADVVRAMIRERIRDAGLQQFAWTLFAGVVECRNQIDERIQESAQNWTVSRMAPTDRNILRLGAFELLYTETPAGAVIDEAVELAKRFGSAQSSQFVNGVLDRMIPAEKRRQTPPELG